MGVLGCHLWLGVLWGVRGGVLGSHHGHQYLFNGWLLHYLVELTGICLGVGVLRWVDVLGVLGGVWVLEGGHGGEGGGA